MGVAVLPPEEFLRNHHHHRQVVFPATKPRRNPNPLANANTNLNRSNRKRRNSPPPPPPPNKPGYQTRPGSPPTTGNIRILKRGEEVSPPRKPLQADGFFAGSIVSSSPPPSSLPLPAFFTAKRNCGLSSQNNQQIECELKRVLKLI